MTARQAPIGATAEWLAAAERAGEQCEHVGKSDRCSRTLAGGHCLYLDRDGRVYCSSHHARKQPATTPAPVADQGSLF